MKPLKIVVEYDYDFVLIGIVAAFKEYKLAWLLNKYLKIELKKSDDLEYNFLKGCKLIISNFIFETEYISFRLLKNKSVDFYGAIKPYLIPELKQYDYLILLNRDYADVNTDYFTEIKKIPYLELVIILDANILPSKDNLLIN